jgi:hypothetical protein
VYVVTEGWYEEKTVKGVVSSEEAAMAWSESGAQRDYCGPFELDEIEE